ncbi:WD40 domain-containing protein [Archangium violaceum]|uniref:WD40 domain-containing protein n=1 Tax=Archangium violaceum TaxID=83451 RepID=UPI0036DCF283
MPGNRKRRPSKKAWKLRHELRGHQTPVTKMAWSPNGELIATPSWDSTIRIWDARTGAELNVLVQHRAGVNQVAWSPTKPLMASVSDDSTVIIWDTHNWKPLRVHQEHRVNINAVAWSPDGHHLVSIDSEGVLHRWKDEGKHHVEGVKLSDSHLKSLAWSPDGTKLAIGSINGQISILDSGFNPDRQTNWMGDAIHSLQWNPTSDLLAASNNKVAIPILNFRTNPSQSTVTLEELEGHTAGVLSVSFSADGRLMASFDANNEIKLWDMHQRVCVAVIKEEYSPYIGTVAFSPKGTVLAAPAEGDTVVKLWDVDLERLLNTSPPVKYIKYANAKVMLVGDSGVGKSGLGLALTGQPFQATDSTHGRQIWTFEKKDVAIKRSQHEQREVLLWDLAGQPGYRVFHRQHLDEIAVALVLFDSRSETDPFAGVSFWSRALDSAARGFPLVKFLVASRSDRGGPTVSSERIHAICTEYGFARFFEVSAKRGDGVRELADNIRDSIPWDVLPRVISPQLFYDMKAFIVSEKEAGRVLSRRADLFQRFLAHKPQNEQTEDVFMACLGRLETVGLVRRMSFGDLVLLQPELLDAFSGWLALAARAEPDGLGFISERTARAGNFKMDADRRLKGNSDEALLITATIEDVVSRGIALRQPTEQGEMLVFPSELRAELPHYPGGYALAVRFSFKGPVREAYATLVVCLTHSPAFSKKDFFRNAALFRSAGGEICGIAVDYPDLTDEGRGRFTVFFEPTTGIGTKLTFLRYVTRQLEAMAYQGTVERERIYQCDQCGKVIPTEDVEWRRGKGGEDSTLRAVRQTPAHRRSGGSQRRGRSTSGRANRTRQRGAGKGVAVGRTLRAGGTVRLPCVPLPQQQGQAGCPAAGEAVARPGNPTLGG